jgi:prepilin-type N-terminal cleavage/methylation domain-containing protein
MSAVRPPRRPRRAAAGFTLIEILAVLLILVLIAGIMLPRLSAAGRQAQIDSGRQLAATLDFAREKAVATGSAHRVLLDFESGSYWIEALPSPPPAEPTLAWAELDELPLVAPAHDAASFAPLPNVEPGQLDSNVRFAEVESEGSPVTEGVAEILFDPDGATPTAHIWLAGADGQRVLVDVAPFADPSLVSFRAAE